MKKAASWVHNSNNCISTFPQDCQSDFGVLQKCFMCTLCLLTERCVLKGWDWIQTGNFYCCFSEYMVKKTMTSSVVFVTALICAKGPAVLLITAFAPLVHMSMPKRQMTSQYYESSFWTCRPPGRVHRP